MKESLLSLPFISFVRVEPVLALLPAIGILATIANQIQNCLAISDMYSDFMSVYLMSHALKTAAVILMDAIKHDAR